MTYFRIEPKLDEFGWFGLDMERVVEPSTLKFSLSL